MVVSSGGVANFTTVSSGAVLVVSSGGQAGSDYFGAMLYGGANVSSGGELVVSSGGTDLGATNAGIEIVASGGTVIDDVVSRYELVQSGGVAQNVALTGGTLEAASGGSVNEAGFHGGSLVLDASTSFHGLVGGFGAGDQIDLQDIAFVAPTKKSGTKASFTEAARNQSGTLMATDGVYTASIELLGQVHSERV
jgi:hypothetical protein